MPKKSNNRVVTAAAALVAGGALAVAGVSLANAETVPSPTGSPSAATGSNAPNGGPFGSASDGEQCERRAGATMGATTEVTGDEATKVTEAVQAKDAAVTVVSVRKHADGPYVVFGTKDGSPVMVEVSADLATVQVRTGGPGGRGGHGGKGGPQLHAHTEVTGDEATKVTEAVQAKDAAVTVASVRKDADGSYDVFGTKDGSPVMVEVSADLATVQVRTGGPGKGGHGRWDRSGQPSQAETGTSTTPSSQGAAYTAGV